MPSDITVQWYGSVVIIYGNSEAGREWLNENVEVDLTWGEHGIAAEPRFVGPIIDGAIEAGLTVGDQR
jgi:hypothetical protein